jgi:hypothetical protein
MVEDLAVSVQVHQCLLQVGVLRVFPLKLLSQPYDFITLSLLHWLMLKMKVLVPFLDYVSWLH